MNLIGPIRSNECYAIHFDQSAGSVHGVKETTETPAQIREEKMSNVLVSMSLHIEFVNYPVLYNLYN